MKVNGGDLMIVIASIVIDTSAEITARGIDGDFVFGVVGCAEAAGATGLVNRVENVEELADAAEFIVGGNGIKASEGSLNEAGARGEIAWQAVSAEAVAVGLEVELVGELVGGFAGGEIEIITKTEGLDGEGRVISKNTDGVVVNFETIGN